MNHEATGHDLLPCLALPSQGLFRVVSAPSFGRQDVGYSPNGPSDRFGMRTGNILLDQNDFAPALEIVFLPEIRFTQEALFTLTGAPRPCELHPGTAHQSPPVTHSCVTQAQPGDRLTFGTPHKGLRTYLCTRPTNRATPQLVGRSRPDFESLCRFLDPNGAIRITPGPEFDRLQNPSVLYKQPWRLTHDMSDRGVTLRPASESHGQKLFADPPEITSAPVNDGTMQLTPSGPLILLRHRPTLGGYPRIASVIDVDIDRLAQHRPSEVVRFEFIEPQTARRLYQQREADLAALRESLS